MKKLILLVFIGALITTKGYSQIQMPPEKPYIDVTGTAEMEVVPDIIHIRILLRERYDGKEKITIEKQENDLREYLRNLSIPDKDLYLSDANSGYVRVKFRTKDVLTQKEYTLIVHSATEVGKVYQGLDKLDIDDATITRLDHSKMEEFRKDVKILAIKAAKNKAIYLLEAIGETTGKPLVITENTIAPYSNPQTNMVYRNSGITSVGEDKLTSFESMEFSKIKVVSSIYIKYEIKRLSKI